MPELPEVETVRRGLAPFLEGATLTRIEVRRLDLRFRLPERFAARLAGVRVGALQRRGKYILAPLDTKETLVIHLGMTGRFGILDGCAPEQPGRFERAAQPDPRHGHVVFETAAGAVITYLDVRRFGSMALINSDHIEAHAPFALMGPEPLGNAFDVNYLASAFAGRRQGPKSLLLDQSVVAGLGNIYVCEALHRARISPTGPAGALARRKLEGLARAIRSVLEEAIEAGGSTLRDFATPAGGTGYFQHRFQVYGRAGEACPAPRCNGVVLRIVQSGRSTFYCPVCQR